MKCDVYQSHASHPIDVRIRFSAGHTDAIITIFITRIFIIDSKLVIEFAFTFDTVAFGECESSDPWRI